MANLITADETSNKIYVHSGITSTVSDSWAAPAGAVNFCVDFDGTNLLAGDNGIIYKYSGVSSTISSSFTLSPLYVAKDLTWNVTTDNLWLIYPTPSPDEFEEHTGFSATITSSFTMSGVSNDGWEGLCHDGTNLISSNNSTAKIYLHSGFTNTVSDSFATPAVNTNGVSYDGTNLLSSSSIADKLYIHSGITSTISSSFSYTYNPSRVDGITTDAILGGGGATFIPSIIFIS